MTYRTSYELTTPSIPAWRRFGLWLNPQRWWFARKARGGHWVLYEHAKIDNEAMLFKIVTRKREWIRAEKCNGLASEHPSKRDQMDKRWYAVAHEDHGEVWG